MAKFVDHGRLPCHQSIYNTLTDPKLDFSGPSSPKGQASSVQEEPENQLLLLKSPNMSKPSFFDSPMPNDELSSSWSAINDSNEYVKESVDKYVKEAVEEYITKTQVPLEKTNDFESNDFESNDYESRNFESNNFGSNNLESKNLESKNLESKNLESKNHESINVESNIFHSNVSFSKSQNLSNDFSVINMDSRPSSASILSNSTDDERTDSMVIIPSFKTPSHILLFETDEEDEPERLGVKRRTLDFGDDASTLISNTGIPKSALFCDSSQPFIMPRLSFTESVDYFNLTIVSSSSSVVLQEANFLKQHIESLGKSANFSLKLSQVSLEQAGGDSKKTSALNLRMTKASDLVLIVNDGSLKIPELLKMLEECSAVPRFVVINLINSNYFINLLDIINVSTPEKIFKTSSLTSGKVLEKIQDLITQEMTIYNPTKNAGTRIFGEKGESEKRKRRKYKQLEKSWISEFGESSYHKRIDPLKITGTLSRLSVFCDVLKRHFSNDEHSTNEKSWLMVSFTVGVGLGITLNAFKIFECLKTALFSNRPKKVIAKVVPRKSILTLLGTHARLLQERVMETFKDFSVEMKEMSNEILSSEILSSEILSNELNNQMSNEINGILSNEINHFLISLKNRSKASADLIESTLSNGHRIITSFICHYY